MLSNDSAWEIAKLLKFIALVMLVTCCIVGCYSKLTFASTSEPVVSVKFNNVPLDVILKEIARQTGFKVYIDNNLQDDFFTGEYESIELTTFLSNLFKDKNTFITVSTESKTIFVNTVQRTKTQSVMEVPTSNKTIAWKNDSVLVSSSKSERGDGVVNDPRYGGIHEVPPLPVTKSSSNNEHLIDSQTGLEWELAEKLLEK